MHRGRGGDAPGGALGHEIDRFRVHPLAERKVGFAELGKEFAEGARVDDRAGKIVLAEPGGLLEHADVELTQGAAGRLVGLGKARQLDGAREARGTRADKQHIHLDRFRTWRFPEDELVERELTLMTNRQDGRQGGGSLDSGRWKRRRQYNAAIGAPRIWRRHKPFLANSFQATSGPLEELMMRRTAVRDPWVWGQMLLAGMVVLGVPFVARRWGTLDPSGITEWVALGFLAVGLAVLFAGMATLGKNLTPATEPLPDGELVTRGIYRVVRHPIYLGVSVVLAGYGLLRGGWPAGALVGAVALAYFERKARVEERWLLLRTPGYEAYRARVPRILPFGWH